MNKIINSLLVSGMLLGGVHQGVSAQTQKSTKAPQSKNIQHKQATQKKVAEVLIMDHDTIIKQSFSSILKIYGKEAGTDTIKQHILIEMNKERAKTGAGPLKLDSNLQIAATDHVNFLYNNRDDYVDDNGNPTGNGHWQWIGKGKDRSFFERIIDSGYLGMDTDEIVFFGKKLVGGNTETRKDGKKNIKEFMTAVWSSKPHRESMLNKIYEDIGIDIVGDVVVVVFGKKDGKKRNRTITKS